MDLVIDDVHGGGERGWLLEGTHSRMGVVERFAWIIARKAQFNGKRSGGVREAFGLGDCDSRGGVVEPARGIVVGDDERQEGDSGHREGGQGERVDGEAESKSGDGEGSGRGEEFGEFHG